MNDFDFQTPSRQSAKGIIVIFGLNSFRVLKGTWVFILLFALRFLRSGEGPDLSHPTIILSTVCIVILLLTIAILQYLNFKFYVKDNYFFLKKGIINKEEVSVSTSKIQNVYLKQNLLQQLIDVVSLTIETAGDDKTEIKITALSRPKAQALKELVLLKSALVHPNKEDDLDEQVYFKASLTKLLLEGISENHLKSFAIIFAFLIGLYNDLQEFVNNVGFMGYFEEWFQRDSTSVMTIIFFNLSFLIVLLFVSLLFSMIKMFVQNYNLTVKRNRQGLEISKGLFNKINLGLTSSRIQKTTVSTNRFKRALGLYKLAFTQTNSNKKQQVNFNIVGLNPLQASELIEQFYPEVEKRDRKSKPHKYMLYRSLYIGLFILLIVNIGLYFLPPQFQLLNILLIGLVIANAYFIYKKAYYSVDEAYIIRAGGGLIDTWSSFLEVHKTQSIQIKETFFQRRRGLAHLVIHSASKSITIPHIQKTEALSISNAILYLVESQNRNWM